MRVVLSTDIFLLVTVSLQYSGKVYHNGHGMKMFPFVSDCKIPKLRFLIVALTLLTDPLRAKMDVAR